MSNLAEQLVASYLSRDTSRFAALAERLHGTISDRRETSAGLLQMVEQADFRQAEAAMVVLSITGMASEPSFQERLLRSAKKLYTSQAVGRVVDEYDKWLQRRNRRCPTSVRLLRSIIRALTTQPHPEAGAFLDKLERSLEGTSLEGQVKAWRKRSDDGG